MTIIDDVITFDFDKVEIDPLWNFGQEKELKIHQIHAYPAKFPAFVTTKAIEYAKEKNIVLDSITDIFCGCGTTAFEAKRNNIKYWGCDINPVATLIAKTKSRKYQIARIKNYYTEISSKFNIKKIQDQYEDANERLKYWYSKDQYNKLLFLKKTIEKCTSDYSDYRNFFLCAFSNILKPASYWLTKSIKPQIDPNKKSQDVYDLFISQYEKMIDALEELPCLGDAENEIVTCNFLENTEQFPKSDMIITSPPYVTSYEYADLHQLSSLWLNFTDNYKSLREGTIGSMYHEYNFEQEKGKLNSIGEKIVAKLEKVPRHKARSVAKYFLDIQATARKTVKILNKNGIALFVIGNTEYKGVKIDNVRHLAESLYAAGYNSVSVSKRKISNKMLTPYRDAVGRFTTNAKGRKIYNEEYILIGRK